MTSRLRVQKARKQPMVCRCCTHGLANRSSSTIHLEAGHYEVIVQVYGPNGEENDAVERQLEVLVSVRGVDGEIFEHHSHQPMLIEVQGKWNVPIRHRLYRRTWVQVDRVIILPVNPHDNAQLVRPSNIKFIRLTAMSAKAGHCNQTVSSTTIPEIVWPLAAILEKEYKNRIKHCCASVLLVRAANSTRDLLTLNAAAKLTCSEPVKEKLSCAIYIFPSV